MTDLVLGRLELGLKVIRRRLGFGGRLSDLFGSKDLSPGIEKLGPDPEFLGDHAGGFPTG